MSTEPIIRIDALEQLPHELRGCVVAIGNFDGVHRGHQAVLEEALSHAKTEGIPAVVLTFEPHPRTFFRADMPVFRLTPAALKAELVGFMGFSAVIELPFTSDLAQQTAEDFITHVLVDCLAIRRVVTGFNFHFGKARQGSPDFLQQAGEKHGFCVSVVKPFDDENAELISSSRIRDCIAEGDIAGAAGLLGYHYSIESEIIRGKQLGRTLGFPTANMALPDEVSLRTGIYAVRFRRSDGTLHDGVASFGYRPTVDDAGVALLETYVFDFDADLYGEICRVTFISHLRDEEKFDGLEPLVEQMKLDEQEARTVLSGIQAIGPLDQALAHDSQST